MLVGRCPWLLALVMACVPGAPDTETPGDPPMNAPSARLAAPPPAPESIEAMCAGLDADDDRLRIRIEDALGKCEDGITRCRSDTTYRIANCSDEPVLVQMLGHLSSYGGSVIYGLGRGRGGTLVGDDVVQIAPGSVWSLTVGYFEDPHSRLRIDIVDTQGDPIPLTAKPVRVSDPARLAALAACEACQGTWDHRDDRGCNCKTRDAGRTCDEAGACEGACLFAHWQVSTPTPRPRCKGKRCAAVPSGIGRPIGRCAVRRFTSCDHFLDSGIAAQPDQPLPWGVDWSCGCTRSGFEPENLEWSAADRRERGEPVSYGSSARAHDPPAVTSGD